MFIPHLLLLCRDRNCHAYRLNRLRAGRCGPDLVGAQDLIECICRDRYSSVIAAAAEATGLRVDIPPRCALSLPARVLASVTKQPLG